MLPICQFVSSSAVMIRRAASVITTFHANDTQHMQGRRHDLAQPSGRPGIAPRHLPDHGLSALPAHATEALHRYRLGLNGPPDCGSR